MKKRMTKLLAGLMTASIMLSGITIPICAEEVGQAPMEQAAAESAEVAAPETAAPAAETTAPETATPAAETAAPENTAASAAETTAPENTDTVAPVTPETPSAEAATPEVPGTDQKETTAPTASETDQKETESKETAGTETAETQDTEPQTVEAEDPEIKLSAKADDPDEVFAEFLEETLNEEVEDTGMQKDDAAKTSLTGQNAAFYAKWYPQVRAVADGERADTRISIPASAFMEKTSFTAEELGIEEGTELTEEVQNLLYAKITVNYRLVYNTLLSKCAYELYWHDKSAGVKVDYAGTLERTEDGHYAFSDDFAVVMQMAVAAGYRVDTYTVDTEKTGAAKNVVARASSVVEKAAAKTDVEKLAFYRDWIQEQVSFDEKTAYDPDSEYGDPWQITYVFDEDPATNVVCEGYAKAFQYLCDLSDFSEDTVESRIVDGKLNGDAHMWNVLEMEDGKNYLVDVTNYDKDYDPALFLSGYDYAVTNGYKIARDNAKWNYIYSKDTRDEYKPEELELSAAAYKVTEPAAAEKETAEKETDPEKPTETEDGKTEDKDAGETAGAEDRTGKESETDAKIVTDEEAALEMHLDDPVPEKFEKFLEMKGFEWKNGTLYFYGLPLNADGLYEDIDDSGKIWTYDPMDPEFMEYFADRMDGVEETPEGRLLSRKPAFSSYASSLNGAWYSYPSYVEGKPITNGIDVSYYQKDINWPAVAASGVRFVIIRAGYRASGTGALREDPKCRSYIDGAYAAGIKVGIYFFSQALNEAEAAQEAQMCASIIEGYRGKISLPVFIDYEYANSSGRLYTQHITDGGNVAGHTNTVNAFCAAMNGYGYMSGVYADRSMLTSKLNVAAIPSNYYIWMANYTAASPYAGRLEAWQYTSRGLVAGINGYVDLDFWYGDFPPNGGGTSGSSTGNYSRPANEASVRQFVTRLYQTVLQRNPDPTGMENWTQALMSGSKSGAEVVDGFYLSQEMMNRRLTNQQYVENAYRGILGRSVDPVGRATWEGALNAGASYHYVINGMTASTEFANLCNAYGIEKGSLTLTEGRDFNLGATQFVARLYQKALNRGYDVEGLNHWCSLIAANSSRENVLNIATDGFFHSLEFQNRNLNDEEFVKALYRTFLNREAEPAGLQWWMERLNEGQGRDFVIRGFAYSLEFSGIMSDYGL